jgi:hypothetical protein
MVHIKEYHAVVYDLLAETALLLQFLPLLTAKFAPVVYKAVVASPYVLLESAMVITVHPTVGVAGVIEEPVDHAEDASMPRRVVFLDLRHLGRKCRGWEIAERRHGSLLTGTNRPD